MPPRQTCGQRTMSLRSILAWREEVRALSAAASAVLAALGGRGGPARACRPLQQGTKGHHAWRLYKDCSRHGS